MQLAHLAPEKRSPWAFLQMQAEGAKLHDGSQALDRVQATNRSWAAPREPGSVICTEPNTPLVHRASLAAGKRSIYPYLQSLAEGRFLHHASQTQTSMQVTKQ